MSGGQTIGQKCMNEYPGKIPVVVNYKDIPFADPNSTEAKKNCSHLLVPEESNVGYLATVIRRKAKISHTESIFLFIDGALVAPTDVLMEVYRGHKNAQDGCLHVLVTRENTFGGP